MRCRFLFLQKKNDIEAFCFSSSVFCHEQPLRNTLLVKPFLFISSFWLVSSLQQLILFSHEQPNTYFNENKTNCLVGMFDRGDVSFSNGNPQMFRNCTTGPFQGDYCYSFLILHVVECQIGLRSPSLRTFFSSFSAQFDSARGVRLLRGDTLFIFLARFSLLALVLSRRL